MSTVNAFLIKCKSHRTSLTQAKRAFVKIHGQVKQSEAEFAKVKASLDALASTESKLKKRLIQASLHYDEQLKAKAETREEISKLRSEIFKLKKVAARVEQDEAASRVSFDKAYIEHSAQEAEARKWSEKLTALNDERILHYNVWMQRRGDVERQKDALHEVKGELDAIKTIVTSTLSTAQHQTSRAYREKKQSVH